MTTYDASFKNPQTTEKTEVGIYTIALSLAGGMAAGIGGIAQDAIGVIGVFA